MKIKYALVLLGCLTANTAFSEGDPALGRTKAETCMGCHAVKGYFNVYPSYKVPKLAGQHAKYIEVALKAYRSGERKHATMQANASNLSDSDIADIAAFFASIPVNTPHAIPQSGKDPVLVQRGQEQAATCAACHGADGNSIAPGFPKLAGQHKSYLIHALENYQTGQRNNILMSNSIKDLSPADIEAVAEYFSNQLGLATPETTKK